MLKSLMRRPAIILIAMMLLSGCASGVHNKYSAGATYTGDLYKLTILSYSSEKGALGVAVLDLESDEITYEPHPEAKHVEVFKGMSFADATSKARDILKRHCGVFTFTTTLLASSDNIHTGYEIRPFIKDTAYCRIGKQVSLNYHGPDSGIIVISLPEREALPFTPGNM